MINETVAALDRQTTRLYQLEQSNAELLKTLDFIAGHARLAKSNYGHADRQSIAHRNGSFENIIKRAEDAIANAKGAAT